MGCAAGVVVSGDDDHSPLAAQEGDGLTGSGATGKLRATGGRDRR